MSERVLKAGDQEYRLPCAACGKTAVTLAVGPARFHAGEDLVYSGIQRGYDVGPEHREPLFALLARDALAEVDAYLEKIGREGLDAYCPECDLIYCREHYQVREEFDDGFYDYAEGTCPQGHTRMIDD